MILTRGLLRAHVLGRADRDSSRRQPLAARVGQGLRDPEIGDESAIRGEQDIGRLDVPVNDVLLMRVVERLRDVAGDREGGADRERPLSRQPLAE
jgi:hypothetical protein